MKYSKLIVESHHDSLMWRQGAITELLNKERWLTKHFGRPGPGLRWFSRSNKKLISAPRDRRFTTKFVYGVERSLYFRDPKDLTLFSLMYNG